MPTNKLKHILVAPLDWGLGHTTRCIPIMAWLLADGHQVTFAGNSLQRSFVAETLEGINFVHLEGYNVTYSKWNKWAQAGLLSQLPRIKRSIADEQKWLKKTVREMQINGIISDNRYGLFHDSIPAVMLTHQLSVRSGIGTIADRVIQQLHFKLLNRFHKIWVVDNEGDSGLAGALSNSDRRPHNCEHIGLLSQFSQCRARTAEEKTNPGQPFILILLSGPEPLRTELSDIIWRQVIGYSGNIVFVEGSLDAITPAKIPLNVAYHKRAAGSLLANLIGAAELVICRSGYSTIMDLVALKKKAILIPTPGQTEQIYLSKYLSGRGLFHTVSQQDFNLIKGIESANNLDLGPLINTESFCRFEKNLAEWVDSL